MVSLGDRVEDIKKLLKKMVKQRAESIDIYKKNNRTEFDWTDKKDHPIDYKELDKENKAFWIEQKKPKRKKMDDSKNGDYFLFCRNKKCNQPIYKNRSHFDTRYCDECC